MLWKDVEDTSPLEETDAGIKMIEPCILSADMPLEDQLANMGASFHEKLFELIAAAGIDNKDVWKNANMDRKHFSKIQCDEQYDIMQLNVTLFKYTNEILGVYNICGIIFISRIRLEVKAD